jgi:hypothetical protein
MTELDALNDPGERVLWSGHCAVAEYAFEEPASLPRWTLPEETEVVVTDSRVIYRDVATGGTGELRWPWPQHLRVQPGNRDTGRSATVTQIQLVCGGPADTFPALVFAGGDLATVGDADRLANILRQAIARYRVEHQNEMGLTAPQARMLSRLVIGPEFSNYQGGEGQTVSLLGASTVVQDEPAAYYSDDAAVYAQAYAEPVAAPIASWGADEGPTIESVRRDPAEWEATRTVLMRPPSPMDEPADLAARAADLAARVAMLVSDGSEPGTRPTKLSEFLATPSDDQATVRFPDESEWGGASRAESVRRTATRLAGNSARARGATTPGQRRADDEVGSTSRGRRH